MIQKGRHFNNIGGYITSISTTNDTIVLYADAIGQDRHTLDAVNRECMKVIPWVLGNFKFEISERQNQFIRFLS